METKFNFKSSVCTSKEQSERLLALGLKKETADMVYTNASLPYYKDVFHVICKEYSQLNKEVNYEISSFSFIPAWSLHRLIEMMPEEMYGGLLCIFKDSIRYEELIMDRPEAHFEVVGDDMYENAISCIEWLIKEGYFNKEYLED